MLYGPDQSKELNILDGNDGSVSPDLLKLFGGIDCTIIVFWLSSAYSHTPQKFRTTLYHFHFFQKLLFTDHLLE